MLISGVDAEISPDRNAWTTPPWVWQLVLDAIGRDTFDLDPCTNEEATVPARLKFMPPQDGLKLARALNVFGDELRGEVWTNPPFSDVGPWFDLACYLRDRGARVWGIVPHSPHIKAWRNLGPDHAWNLGRVGFVPPPGAAESQPMQEHDLVLWGDPGASGELLDASPRTLYRMRRLMP